MLKRLFLKLITDSSLLKKVHPAAFSMSLAKNVVFTSRPKSSAEDAHDFVGPSIARSKLLLKIDSQLAVRPSA